MTTLVKLIRGDSRNQTGIRDVEAKINEALVAVQKDGGVVKDIHANTPDGNFWSVVVIFDKAIQPAKAPIPAPQKAPAPVVAKPVAPKTA